MTKTNPQPPVAASRPVVHERHGDRRTDEYSWLRERDHPDVMAHLHAENAFLAKVMEPLRGLQGELYQEMLSHVQETDDSPPVPWGDFEYYTRTVEGLDYPIHCRRHREGGAEEVLLDGNELKRREGLENVWIGRTLPSRDHALLAYQLDTAGAERYELRVRDLMTGAETRTGVQDVSDAGLAWSADGSYLYYIRNDEAWRPFEVYRHRLGEDPASDERLYREDDETYTLRLNTSDSGDELLLTSDSTMTTEVRRLRATDTSGAFEVIAPRRRGVEYSVEDGGHEWLILTNEDGAREFKLIGLAKEGGEVREILPHDEARFLEGVTVFENFLLVSGRSGGTTRLWVLRRDEDTAREVTFPEEVYTVRVGENHEFAATTARLVYTSLVTPSTHLDLNLETLELREVKRTPVPNYDPELYTSSRMWITARDGARVPVSLVHRKDIARPAKTLLYGYGSYGLSINPSFMATRLPLLDRGFVFAIAHIRGGGEMGRAWYEGGKLHAKSNTFTDFVDVAEHLVGQGVTTPSHLAVMGRSAGGLLMGAVTNMRPDLFKVVLAGVPFVDVVTTMLDASIPLTTLEWDEWGNPADPTFYEVMKAYSPYDNVEAKAYPHLWISTGLNDPRVAYWEPAKWAARLRERKTDGNVLVLKTLMGGGHFSSSGRYDALKETAEEYAFMIAALEGRFDA
ncbi:S9 family peptidase [Deinococcus yavapaiensis]|uniref:Oligopeptidase B n=1 Tax=Deinococcus yavapaiensis KR-236 TaxID=694435 RepID=A0A318S5M6_9DEIO|nr:S9 family peptidase [Deinococcus yavapaiensis]PYE48969.1 oligopeptidase B [Deinococcus yavapaiensis KR-236]